MKKVYSHFRLHQGGYGFLCFMIMPLLFTTLAGCSIANSNLLGESVFISISPGKPGAPTESIEILKSDSQYMLRIQRIDTYGELIKSKEIAIPAKKFALVWNIVAQEELISFVPKQSDKRAFDFGMKKISLQWKYKNSDELQSYQFIWIKPLLNENKVAELIEVMALISKEYASEVPLFYFPRD